jgi:hypothetical protein
MRLRTTPPAARGASPHTLMFFERMQRLQTAIACGTPEQGALSHGDGPVAANAVGCQLYRVRVQRRPRRGDHAGGDGDAGPMWDSLQFPTYAPMCRAWLWLAQQ